MEHRGSISDDWEELSDTFSVVSVPASGHGDDQPLLDGDLPDMEKPAAVADLPLRPARSRPFPAEAPAPSLPVPIPQPREAPISEPSLAVSASDVLRRASPNEKAAQMERKQEEDSYTSDFRLDEKEDARRQPTDWQRAAPPGRSPSDLSSDGEVDEILDAHVDPAFFLNVLKSLGGMIDEILAMAATLTSYQSATAIEKVCGLLSAQIQELTPIISGYARCWSSSAQDIPLDPGLQAWMSGVRVRLLGLHDEMQRQCTHPRHSYPSNCDFEVTCQEHCGALSQYEKQMDMFLPIMQVDYNEFEAGQINFPLQQTASRPDANVSPIDLRNPSTATRPHPARPSSDTWQLRQALYELRDRLQDTVEKLSQCTSILTPSASALCRDVVQSYGVLFNNLSLILSNHGSDWIEHGLRGGLTYAQFMDIDVGVIRDFTAQLSQALDCLGDGPGSVRSTYWEQRYGDPRQDETSKLRERAAERYGAQSRRRSLLLDDGLLASFETLAEVLTATLIPSQA